MLALREFLIPENIVIRAGGGLFGVEVHYPTYSFCVCWTSVRETRAQRFLSVRVLISASTGF